MNAVVRSRDENGNVTSQTVKLDGVSGMAPKCKLVSLRVLDASGRGGTSNLIKAISKIQDINDHGRRILIHGVNISVGNSFDPEWFACGQSPLCVEVNQLVKSGVVVVVAAGNSGYGKQTTSFTSIISAGFGMTINDPGNCRIWQSRSGPPIVICRTSTASRTSLQKDRPAMVAPNRTWLRPAKK